MGEYGVVSAMVFSWRILFSALLTGDPGIVPTRLPLRMH